MGDGALVDMQVEADAELARGGHDAVELARQVGVRLRESPHRRGPVRGRQADDAVGLAAEEVREAEEAHRLDLDAAPPLLAQAPDGGERAGADVAARVDVRAQGDGPMGPGAP